MVLGAVAGGAAIGAGVGVSSVALAPFNAANTFLGSAFFGYGMILGERYMYQEDWPKIQQRLVNGEKIENIIQEYTGTFTAVVMEEAKIIFATVTREFIEIMKQALAGALEPNPELTPEEERRRSRGGGSSQAPITKPAPVFTPPPTVKQTLEEKYPEFVNLKSLVRDMNNIMTTTSGGGLKFTPNPLWYELKNSWKASLGRLRTSGYSTGLPTEFIFMFIGYFPEAKKLIN